MESFRTGVREEHREEEREEAGDGPLELRMRGETELVAAEVSGAEEMELLFDSGTEGFRGPTESAARETEVEATGVEGMGVSGGVAELDRVTLRREENML